MKVALALALRFLAPKKAITAFKAYVSLLEYGVPKMARNELAPGEDGKTEIIVRWQGEGEQ